MKTDDIEALDHRRVTNEDRINFGNQILFDLPSKPKDESLEQPKAGPAHIVCQGAKCCTVGRRRRWRESRVTAPGGPKEGNRVYNADCFWGLKTEFLLM